MEIGAWGRLVGFAIAFAYFGIGNSEITGGQTIGKKALKLRVVNSENSPIGIGKSILRYIILATPVSLNGAHFTNESKLTYLIYPLSFILFGGLLSTLYLYLFNRVTRQTLHDLIVGTYVVNSEIERQKVGTVWIVHIVVTTIIFLAAAVVPSFTTKLAQNELFREMLAVQSALINQPNVTYVTISTNTAIFASTNDGTKTTTFVSSQVFLSEQNVNDANLARQLASLVIKNYPEAKNKDTLQITLTYGFDIGIWSQWSSHKHRFNPRELKSSE